MDPSVAENYQLKWHSFGSYFHSCVASALQNESFADVALVTVDGRQIMAHRFVLSACSQFLHQVLKLQAKVTTTLPLMIILPPEINYRTLKTLIQYMYSGEATVSKDILEPVLRGGDILKVKGLWRPNGDENFESRIAKVRHENENSESAPQKPINKPASKKTEPKEKNMNNGKVINCKIINVVQKEQDGAENRAKSPLNIKNQPQNTVIRRTEDEKQKEQQELNGDFNSEQASNDSTLQFLVIKEEPVEWSEVNESVSEMKMVDEGEMFSTEMTIKPEIFMEENSQDPSELYSPLTCELCTETFSLPGDWVRHVQTHTDMLPAKRQRRGKSSPDEENDVPFPPLHCDLCQKYFSTPGEWVHHIQDTHTEFELHLSNKCAPGKIVKTPRSFVPAQNSCAICSKRFPSHASLLIHKRTHTGEKPYMCDMCCKGFNVKSNLLRHLRTVHDKIINPAEVDDAKEDVNVE